MSRRLTLMDEATDLQNDDVLAGVQAGKGGRQFSLASLASFFGALGGGGGGGYVDLDGGTVTGVTGSVTDLDGGNASG
jgi:hypothetical protein